MNIDVKPNTALVSWPLAVDMSWGRAKKARYVSEFPSSSNSFMTAPSRRRVPAMMRSATSRILERSLIAVRWMNVNESCSLILSSSISMPFARSIALRASSCSPRASISPVIARSSRKRPMATSIAGIRSLFWNGLTR